MGKRSTWTPEDDDRLRALAASGENSAAIAVRLNRTPAGVRKRAMDLGIKLACACRKSNPDILVVQPAENGAAKNVPGPLDGARDWRILLQG